MKKCSKCRKQQPEENYISSETKKVYTTCNTCRDYTYRMERSIKAGVYVIKENGTPIYVGESDVPYRRRKEHFSRYKGWNSVKYKSEVTKAIFRNELDPSNLTFEMLHENIDNGVKHSQKRKDLEKKEILKLNPKYNLI